MQVKLDSLLPKEPRSEFNTYQYIVQHSQITDNNYYLNVVLQVLCNNNIW